MGSILSNAPTYSQFRQRYRKIKYIHKNSSSQFHLVKDSKYQITHTEKTIKYNILPQHTKDFIDYAQTLMKLTHPNIISAYDYIIQQTQDIQENEKKQFRYLHVIMQTFEGSALKNYFGRLKVKHIIQIYKQLRSGIEQLQNEKIIHRDLNNENVLMNKELRVKIPHFEISRKVRERVNGQKQVQQRQKEMKKYFDEQKNPKYNLFLLGIIIVQLYFGQDIRKIYQIKTNQPDQFPKQFYLKYQNQIPPQIIHIITPLLQKDPTKRLFHQIIQNLYFIHFKSIQKYIKSNITQLRLQYSNLTNQAAQFISKSFKNLTSLYLKYNKIDSDGVGYICKQLIYLRALDLSNNMIDKKGGIQIGDKLKNLQCLYLENNKVQMMGAIKIVKNCKRLKILNLYGNKIQAFILEQICKNLNRLNYLNLTLIQTQSTNLRAFQKQLKKLTHLQLPNSNINHQGVKHIAKNLNQLKILNLNSNNINNQTIKFISNLRLKELYLQKNLIDHQSVPHITQIYTLQILNLNYNNISDIGTKQISKNLKRLKALYLSNNNIHNEGGISISINSGDYIQRLNIQNNNIQIEGLMMIVKSLKKIEILEISGNRIKEGQIRMLIENLKCLKSLKQLRLQNSKINSDQCIQLGKSLKKLQKLCLNNNLFNTDSDIKFIVQQIMPQTSIQM